MRHMSRRVTLSAAVGVSMMVLPGGGVCRHHGRGDNPWPYAATTRSPVLVTVGDIACQPGAPVDGETRADVRSPARNRALASTANEVEAFRPDLVALLGDEQYQVGRYSDFQRSFDRTYGAFKFLQRPAPGSHEFCSGHGEIGDRGEGDFDYYNGVRLDLGHRPAGGRPHLPLAGAAGQRAAGPHLAGLVLLHPGQLAHHLPERRMRRQRGRERRLHPAADVGHRRNQPARR